MEISNAVNFVPKNKESIKNVAVKVSETVNLLILI